MHSIIMYNISIVIMFIIESEYANQRGHVMREYHSVNDKYQKDSIYEKVLCKYCKLICPYVDYQTLTLCKAIISFNNERAWAYMLTLIQLELDDENLVEDGNYKQMFRITVREE